MNIRNLKNTIKAVDLAGDSLLIKGEAGIGKSESVKQYATQENYYFVDLRLGNQEVGDLIGIPTISNGVTIWTEPNWLSEMKLQHKNGKKCLLFLDELNRSQPDVKASALQIVLDKQIHQHKLPDNTLIIAAINPEDSQFNIYQVDSLDPALLDRFTVVELETDVSSWLEWAKSNDIDDVIIDFITENNDSLHKIYEDGKIGPTPRSWAAVDKYVKLFYNKQIDYETLITVVNGRIGSLIGSKFIVHINREAKLNVNKFLNKLYEMNLDKVKNENDETNIFIRKSFDKLDPMYLKEKIHEIITRSKDIKYTTVVLDNIPEEILAAILKEIEQDLIVKIAECSLNLHGTKRVILKGLPNSIKQMYSLN